MTETHDIHLTGMAHGGSAVGRLAEGKAVFVPYAIPEEQVRVQIVQDKGRFANAELVEVLESSPDRIEPRCKHFGVCGGCQWQHIAYPAQLRIKQQIVTEQLARIGGLKEVTIHPTLPSPNEWEYRTHATVQISKRGEVGFISTNNRTVIDLEECHIVRPELFELIEQLQDGPPPLAERLRIQIGSTTG
jgi:23S rRNA (uracil1939-C5)-methyltransferase